MNDMKEEIIRFLRECIAGKTLVTDEVVYKLEDGNLEGVYCDEMLFSDISVTEHGFRFNMTTVTKERLYQLDDTGKRAGLVKDFTGTSVFRYELATRKSTSRMTGYMRCISSTVKDHTMEAVVYGVFNVIFDGKELRWEEMQLLYRDTPVGEGKYRPVAFDSKVRFYLDGGKVVFEYLPTHSEVNPDTLEKTLSEGHYPPYVSREKSI